LQSKERVASPGFFFLSKKVRSTRQSKSGFAAPFSFEAGQLVVLCFATPKGLLCTGGKEAQERRSNPFLLTPLELQSSLGASHPGALHPVPVGKGKGKEATLRFAKQGKSGAQSKGCASSFLHSSKGRGKKAKQGTSNSFYW
jgi:hypothetical protein